MEQLNYFPQTDDEFRESYSVFHSLNNEIFATLDTTHHNYSYLDDSIPFYYHLNLIHNLNAITNTDKTIALCSYTKNERYNFFNAPPDDTYIGLKINIEAGSHFKNEIPDVTFMPAVEEYMKQTPQHFIKIFTTSNSRIIYVYSNKDLRFKDICELYLINLNMHHIDNPTFKNFLEAWKNNDITKGNKVIKDYFNSDIANKRIIKKCSACINGPNTNRIKQLERKLESSRERITEYENQIAALARVIRESNETITFLSDTNHTDEEAELITKYILRSPYITNFNMEPALNKITLYYSSPITYFNSAPAEKMIQRYENTEPIFAGILKAILERKYTLYTRCAIDFYTDTFNTSAVTVDDSRGLFKHPHLDRFNCFGNHRTAIAEAAENSNYIGAIEQITQATMNLNFYDGCVIRYMLETLNKRLMTLNTWKDEKTGNMLTTYEVITN